MLPFAVRAQLRSIHGQRCLKEPRYSPSAVPIGGIALRAKAQHPKQLGKLLPETMRRLGSQKCLGLGHEDLNGDVHQRQILYQQNWRIALRSVAPGDDHTHGQVVVMHHQMLVGIRGNF